MQKMIVLPKMTKNWKFFGFFWSESYFGMVQSVFQNDNTEFEKFSHWKFFLLDIAIFSKIEFRGRKLEYHEMDEGTHRNDDLRNHKIISKSVVKN